MNKDKAKIFILFALIGVICSIVILIIVDTTVPVEPGRSNPRQTQEPIRATATSIPAKMTPTVRPLTGGTPDATPSPQPTRIQDATSIPTPIGIIVNPPYSP